jgi:hypothetical protein
VKRSVIQDFKYNFAPEPRVDGRRSDVRGHSQTSLFTSAFNTRCQLSFEGKGDVFRW